MRLIAVEACGPLALVLPREQVVAAVLPVMQQFAGDKSWRVRYNVAQQVPWLPWLWGWLPLVCCCLEQCSWSCWSCLPLRSLVVVWLISCVACGFSAWDGASCTDLVLPTPLPQVPALAAVLGSEATRTELLPPFVRLLRDGEAEVRAAAAGRIAAVCQLLPPDDVAAAVVPAVRELAGDVSQYVRAALAGTVMELAPLLGKVGSCSDPDASWGWHGFCWPSAECTLWFIGAVELAGPG